MIDTKKQQVTEELQHIEDRIKRNFENRSIIKPDNNESTEQEIHDNEEHFEDVLTESQVSITTENNMFRSNESEEDNQKQNDLSENSVNINEHTVGATEDNMNGEQVEKLNSEFENITSNNADVLDNTFAESRIVTITSEVQI